jgi:hypothetical protein
MLVHLTLCLREQMANQSPLGILFPKPSSFKASCLQPNFCKLFTAKCLQAAMAGPILGIDFMRKFRITVAPETSQVLFACTATAPAATKPLLPKVLPIVEPFVSVPSATEKIPDILSLTM